MGSFIIFSSIGSYVPLLFGGDIFASFLFGTVGGIVGIWIGWKIITTL